MAAASNSPEHIDESSYVSSTPQSVAREAEAAPDSLPQSRSGMSVDVQSAEAMAAVNNLALDTSPRDFAGWLAREGTGRIELLHRNDVHVKMRTADGKQIWTREVSACDWRAAPGLTFARDAQEDTQVLGFVVSYVLDARIGPGVPYINWAWEKCASRFVTSARTGKQCRERWANVLNPMAKHDDDWGSEEIDLLIDLHRQYGKKWREIAKRCPGRSTNKVKNLFYSCERRVRRALPHAVEETVEFQDALITELRRVQLDPPRHRARKRDNSTDTSSEPSPKNATVSAAASTEAKRFLGLPASLLPSTTMLPPTPRSLDRPVVTSVLHAPPPRSLDRPAVAPVVHVPPPMQPWGGMVPVGYAPPQLPTRWPGHSPEVTGMHWAYRFPSADMRSMMPSYGYPVPLPPPEHAWRVAYPPHVLSPVSYGAPPPMQMHPSQVPQGGWGWDSRMFAPPPVAPTPAPSPHLGMALQPPAEANQRKRSRDNEVTPPVMAQGSSPLETHLPSGVELSPKRACPDGLTPPGGVMLSASHFFSKDSDEPDRPKNQEITRGRAASEESVDHYGPPSVFAQGDDITPTVCVPSPMKRSDLPMAEDPKSLAVVELPELLLPHEEDPSAMVDTAQRTRPDGSDGRFLLRDAERPPNWLSRSLKYDQVDSVPRRRFVRHMDKPDPSEDDTASLPSLGIGTPTDVKRIGAEGMGSPRDAKRMSHRSSVSQSSVSIDHWLHAALENEPASHAKGGRQLPPLDGKRARKQSIMRHSRSCDVQPSGGWRPSTPAFQRLVRAPRSLKKLLPVTHEEISALSTHLDALKVA
jgi:hypothetical protein